jgi:glycogen synthase kinase 3 beta
MNPNYKEYRLPKITPISWDKVFKPNSNPLGVKFVSSLLVYNPEKRPNPMVALLDPYFDELRQ